MVLLSKIHVKKRGCDPTKLKEYFKHHFNRITDKEDPIELTDAPAFIIKLQDVNIGIRTTPLPTIKKCEKY